MQINKLEADPQKYAGQMYVTMFRNVVDSVVQLLKRCEPPMFEELG